MAAMGQDPGMASANMANVAAQGSNMDLILQLPLAAGFALLAFMSLLQSLLPKPLSRRISTGIHMALRNTVLATVMATLAVGMLAAVAATAAQLRFLYLSNAPPAPLVQDDVGNILAHSKHARSMSTTAGLSATAAQGAKLWTTLLLGLADIVLVVNIWGHAKDQERLLQLKTQMTQKPTATHAQVDTAPAGASTDMRTATYRPAAAAVPKYE